MSLAMVAGVGCGGSKLSGAGGNGGNPSGAAGTSGGSGTTGTGGMGGGSAGTGGSGAAGGSNMDAGPDVPIVTNPLEHVTATFPARGATGVCTDAPLRLTFDTPPAIGTSGTIRVYQQSLPSAPVDMIDIGAPLTTILIAGRSYFYRPIVVSGNEAYIYLRKVLQPGATYFVNIDPGVLTAGAGGAAIGAVEDATSWRFTVRAAAPAAGATTVNVAADGTGDFCTVQGAIDYIPAANTTPVTVNVAAGTYREIVAIASKNNITFHGADRNTSVITYANNGALQVPPGTTTSLGTKWRAMFGIDTSNDIVIENITLWNPSPQLSTNGQSETLRSEGGNRIIVRNATIRGLQDTLLFTGQVYIADSTIEGNVDYIWGNGVAYFDRCEIKDVNRKGYNVQARNGAASLGYVFVDCALTADAAITGHYLARTDKNNNAPASQVAYINCKLGPHIDPVGWLLDGYTRPTGDAGVPDGGTQWNFSMLRFAEYKSVDMAGAPIDVSMRIPESKQL
ncbi:MAG TPA: pectinesterase family protein, partial [Polyangia bacterium]|nr:pectinesterase family protein [Polyangia bacterium]